MDDWVERYGIAAVIALVIHGVAAISVASVEDESVLVFKDVLPDPTLALVDIEVEVPLPLPLPPETETETETEPETPEPPAPEPEKIEPAPRPTPEPATEPPPAEPPPTSDEPPAPGWAEGDDAPGMAFQLGETGPAATAKVAVTQGRGKRPSRVGSGSNRGGGGAATSKATGRPSPKPVSIASIKRRALPIGNNDVIQAKDYPGEAKRLGIEGTVKVKLIVNASGKVTKRTLVKKLGHGFDRLAFRYAGKLKFKPAIDTNDRPVASVVIWTFRFVLPD